MPVRRRAKRRTNYTAQERRVLLTGVPLHLWSTRFGHPLHGGWNRDEIAVAWDLLQDELLELWETEDFALRRKGGGRPFAERLLSDG